MVRPNGSIMAMLDARVAPDWRHASLYRPAAALCRPRCEHGYPRSRGGGSGGLAEACCPAGQAQAAGSLEPPPSATGESPEEVIQQLLIGTSVGVTSKVKSSFSA